MLNAFCLFALEQLYLYLKLHGNVKTMKKKKKSGLICISPGCLQVLFWSRLQMVKTRENIFLSVVFLHFKRCYRRWSQQKIVKCYVYLYILAFHCRVAFLFISVCGFGASIVYAAPQEFWFCFLYTLSYSLCSLSEWLACEKEYIDFFFLQVLFHCNFVRPY